MFIDEAKIWVKAGDGGNGCMAFRREKFVPRGGPSGGDGGRGADIVMEASERHNTLVHFRFNPEYKGRHGEHGLGSNCTGLTREDVVLKVPVGTLVFNDDTGELVHEFMRPDERFVVPEEGAADAATSTLLRPRIRLRANTNRATPDKNSICGSSSSCWPMSALSDIRMSASPR